MRSSPIVEIDVLLEDQSQMVFVQDHNLIQTCVGLAVIPASVTFRVLRSMKNKTYSVFKKIVSTVKKSQAMIARTGLSVWFGWIGRSGS